MSFYLGQSTLGGKVMHIAKNSHNKSEMQGGIILDTVFHSDLSYITYNMYPGVVSGSMVQAPTEFFTEIVTNKKLYFVIYKVAGVWQQSLTPAINAPSNILWYTAASGGTMSYYPSVSYPWAQLVSCEECYFVVINIAQSGYLEPVKTDNELILRNGDIIVNSIDLFDLLYINANPINSEDISFNTNNGQFQLINSTPANPGLMSILSNPSVTNIYNGTKLIFTTSLARDKVFFDSIIAGSLPYGSVTTRGSGTWYRTIYSPGTFEVGDMFFIKYYADGNTGNDFETASNMMVRFVVGEIAYYSYNFHPFWYYHVSSYYYGNADGSLSIKLVITINAAGTLVSKRYDFTTYKLK